ncbi:hypothetical protein AN214_04262 [Pseudoalteromonas sp. P1-9]|uniref:hypothetical protein n=1 Tax=Pseudoalteromonas sp. P1-9 TaxID=1710354 RepID=UPI0006D5DAB4|nr:hypothetical protein [Pseudoalteromonas sp. P1-9]KPV93709.1 hypothetical protein AN214_04262 [Pseudoalteromonas sp. P1-9]
MEHNIWYCEKRESRNGVTLSFVEDDSVNVVEDDLDLAIESMQLLLLEKYGDGEAVVEIVDKKKEHVAISYNESVFSKISLDNYFTFGCCKKCSYPLGNRNNKPIELKELPSLDIASVRSPFAFLRVYSEKFINKLPKRDLENFEVRKVLFEDKDSGYVELIANQLLTAVGKVGASYPTIFDQSWECAECGRRSFATQINGKSVHTPFFLSQDYYQTKKRNLIPFASSSGVNKILIATQLWSDLITSKEFKGLVSDKIVLLNNLEAEVPNLPIVAEFEEL